MRASRRLAAAAAASLTLLLGAALPASAATTEIRPARLDRGADVAVPHVEGRHVVDGDRRIDVGTRAVQLLGTSGDAYVVVAADSQEWRGARVLRVAGDGTTTVLVRRAPLGRVVLSDDGERLVVARAGGPGRSRVQVRDAGTGEPLASRALPGYVTVLDADRGRVLVSSWQPQQTLVWRVATGRTHTVLDRAAYEGDLGLDRVAWFTRDPYEGGCSVVASVSDPTARVWRSCRDAVESWSPDGSRMLTVHKLTDGLGPAEVSLRDAGGALLARYTVDGWFGSLGWEDDQTVLLGAHARRFAMVRCTALECERASDLRRAQPARPAR